MDPRNALIREMWGNPYHTYADDADEAPQVETTTVPETSHEIIDEKPSASEMFDMQAAWGWNATSMPASKQASTCTMELGQPEYQEPEQVELDVIKASWAWNAYSPSSTSSTEDDQSIEGDADIASMSEMRELTEDEVNDLRASWGWNTRSTSSQPETPANVGNIARFGRAFASIIEKVINPGGSTPATSDVGDVREYSSGEVEVIKSAWGWNAYVMSLSNEEPCIIPVDLVADKEVSAAEAKFAQSMWAWNAYPHDLGTQRSCATVGDEETSFVQAISKDIEEHHITPEKGLGVMPPPIPTPEVSPESIIASELHELPAPLAI